MNTPDKIKIIKEFIDLGYDALFDWCDPNNHKERRVLAEAYLIKSWVFGKGYFINIDISPTSGLYEWFIHSVSNNIDEIAEGNVSDLIEESDGYVYVDPDEAVFNLLEKIVSCHYSDRICLQS